MPDFKHLKVQYLKLRESVIKYLDQFDEKSYFYQPTIKSNTTAWIIPHISAFEKLMVIDKIEGYNFGIFISQEEIEKYKPGVDAFNFKKEELMDKKQAIELLGKTQEVSIKFLDDMIAQTNSVKAVDPENAFNRYFFNFSHETEHYGQIKYLIGTWKRTH
ncbi:MAG: DinB family protein [Candidatus Hermodarchaeota archaeon]